jgi:hypothetical protein
MPGRVEVVLAGFAVMLHADDLTAEIDAAMKAYPSGVMPRIGLCSWKDSSPTDLPSFGQRGVLHTITTDSERVGRALLGHVSSGVPAVLHLRAWQEMPKSSEFRVFIRGGQIVGVSQYHWRQTFSELLLEAHARVAMLQELLIKMLPVVHMADCIIDVCVHPGAAFVIEVNPFIKQTDYCLFGQDGRDDFDGSLRLLNGRDIVSVLPS